MGLHISASGILNALLRNDITANNIANSRTSGYRAARPDNVDSAGGGVRIGGVSLDLTSGPYELTGRSTDVAAPDGFFRVVRPDGSVAYTRDGSFGLNADGELVTSDGARLDPPIQAPPGATSVTIARDGSVFVTVNGDFEPRLAGRIQVFQFPNPNGLEAIGSNFLRQTFASGEAVPVAGVLESGVLEQSNVNLVREMSNMILDTSAFRANAGAFRVQSEMMGALLDIRR